MAKSDSFILSFTKPIFDLCLNHPFFVFVANLCYNHLPRKKNCETRAAVTVVNTNFTKTLAWVVWPGDAANSSHTQLFTLRTRYFVHFYPISKQGACYRHQMYLCYNALDRCVVQIFCFIARQPYQRFVHKNSALCRKRRKWDIICRATCQRNWPMKKKNVSKVADSRLTLSLPYADFLQNCGYVLGQK